MPLVWPLLTLILWHVPMRPRVLKSVLVAMETSFAWAMLDIFVVTLAASLLQLDPVAKFTLGDECTGINKVLTDYPSVGSLLPGEASCFGVAPTLDAGYWLLLSGAVLTTLAGGYATIAGHAALSEHLARAKEAR